MPLLQVLINALLNGSDQDQDKIITHIAFTQNAHVDFVKQLEALLKKDSTKEDALILAYGALAGAASSSVQHRVMLFIKQRLVQQMALNDTSTTVHLLHALGNTGSKNITDLLFDYFSHSSSDEVKLAALGAARMITTHKPVQDTFIAILESDPEEYIVEEIAKTLLIGEEHSQLLGEHVKENNVLLNKLVSSSLRFRNNIDLHQLVQQYLETVDTDESRRLGKFLEEQTGSRKRMRRASTTDWDASNSLYDNIAPRSTRQSDVTSYPQRKAYLWGKEIGISKINIQLSTGTFTGHYISANTSRSKLFGKAIARGNVFKYSATIAEALADVHTDSGISTTSRVRFYIKIGGRYLVNIAFNQSCLDKSKTYSYERTVMQVSVRVPVYVTTVTFYARLNLKFGLTVQWELCWGARICSVNSTGRTLLGLTDGKISLLPYVGVTPEGGVHVSVLVNLCTHKELRSMLM